MNKSFIILFLVFSMVCFSQDQTKKYKFNFQLDNRISSIRGNTITLFGGKIGVQYKNLTRFGVGASFIVNPVEIRYINKQSKLEEVNSINFWYGSFFNDWILYKNDNWECFVSEQIGFGKPSFVRLAGDEVVTDVAIPLFVNEISGQINYKMYSWLGFGAGIGYRNILNSNSKLKSALDAPIYILKIIIYPESILKGTR